eukprot:CAMPEP_0168623682 /NCGR_PEP_ID=MMETSP0449_2-20121227/8963_1 /TAXON_ID=1082188 /ORGANISM="Strombidium rassoulzadegani, Strain ras09" /LENGTH=76 /DNA_ID=CAMNT_0008665095 /DNA_START=323 /DNA_END=553 /DNA_ORIENTATION=+
MTSRQHHVNHSHRYHHLAQLPPLIELLIDFTRPEGGNRSDGVDSKHLGDDVDVVQVGVDLDHVASQVLIIAKRLLV